MRARRTGGFTLVELMVVVAIVSVVGALAARMYSKGVRGESAPAFTRTLMSTVMDARHMALTLGRMTRVTLAPAASTSTPAMTVTTDAYDPTVPTWVTQTKVSMPTSMQFCTPQSGISTSTPTCPMSSANVLCFWPNGRVSLQSSATCATTSPSAPTGATLFLENTAGDKKYKLFVWGLTGMTKTVDQW